MLQMSKISNIISDLRNKNKYCFSYISKAEEGRFEYTITFQPESENFVLSAYSEIIFCEPETKVSILDEKGITDFLNQKINYLH
jgi:hypothetical protein